MGRKLNQVTWFFPPSQNPFPEKKEAGHCATTSLHSTTYLGTQTRKPRLHLNIATTYTSDKRKATDRQHYRERTSDDTRTKMEKSLPGDPRKA